MFKKKPNKHNFSLTQPGQKWPVWVQIGLSAIPYAGGPLSIYFGEVRQKKVQERLERYFSYFKDELTRLDEEKVDKPYLETDEFGEIFARGAEEAARSTTDERIRRFANIVLNNALSTPAARQRTTGLLPVINQLSDLDAFILLCFGPPNQESLRAESRSEALELVGVLAKYLNIEIPPEEAIIDSIIYMDNLGVTWVSQREIPRWAGTDTSPIREFSVFRPPLGDAVVKAITPPAFFLPEEELQSNAKWPEDMVSGHFRNSISAGNNKDLNSY